MSTRQHLLAADFSAAYEGSHPAAAGDFKGWNFDPTFATANQTGTSAGVLDVTKIQTPGGGSVSSVLLKLVTAGVTPTTDQVWIGLYDSTKTKVAASTSAAAVTGLTGSAALNTVAVAPATADLDPSAGFFYVVLLWNGGTAPVLGGAASGGATNAGLAAATFRRATGGTGLTALPTTLPTLSTTATTPWFGLK